MSSSTRLLTSLCLFGALLLAACKGKNDATTEDAGALEEDTEPEVVEAIDAGAEEQRERPKIAVLDQVTPIFNAREWPPKDPTKATEARRGVERIGYMRRGQVVEVRSKISKKSNCPEGWYELVTGGFVCGKSVTTDLEAKELENAPHPPYMDRPLPYEYGLNITNGTPLYRRRPFKKEREELEKGLLVGKTKPGEKRAAAGPNAPWYLRDHGGKRPQLTEKDLYTNEYSGLVFLRMVKGFYLSLDERVSAPSGRFWRTTAGYFTPTDHILVHKSVTEFEGVRFDAEGETRKLPLAWVIGARARKYQIEEGDPTRADQKDGKLLRGDAIERFTAVPLTGKSRTVEGRGFFETEEGWWARDYDVTVSRPGPPPADLAPGEKWIEVNVSTQTLVAFEGDKPFYATLVSTGRRNEEDESRDYRTPQGEWRVRDKHIAATMDDVGSADGPYSIQDVPWILYYDRGYALHGAFWHSAFGRERSHGCTNLTPHDAKIIFDWVGPTLPEGWHGVRATDDNPGTRIVVRGDAKPASDS